MQNAHDHRQSYRKYTKDDVFKYIISLFHIHKSYTNINSYFLSLKKMRVLFCFSFYLNVIRSIYKLSAHFIVKLSFTVVHGEFVFFLTSIGFHSEI